MNRAWERQAYDTDESFAAFVRFRDEGPRRRLLRAGAGPTAKLSEWYRQDYWRERVAAYDAHMDGIALDEREKVARATAADVATKHKEILGDVTELVDREFSKLLVASREGEMPGLLKPADLTRLLEQGIKLDRLVREQSTEKTAVDLSGVDLDELRALEEKLRR